MEKKRGQKQKKLFRISAKSLFLTYSQCDINLKEVLKQLKIKLERYNIKEYVLTKEEHSLGSSLTENKEEKGKHIHVYIKTEKKVEILNPNRLDLEHENKSYHGNYQTVKERDKVLTYILKDIFYKDPELIIYSVNLEHLIKDNGTLLSYQESMVNLAEEGKIKEAMDLLKRSNISQYLKSHMSIEKSLRSIYLKSRGAISRFNLNQFIIPESLKKDLLEIKDTKQTLFLQGQGGTGKTSFIIAYVMNELKLNPLIINHYDGLRDFQIGYHNCIIIDDICLEKISREVVLKLVDSTDETTFDVKYGSIRIPADTQRFLLTNKSLEEMIRFVPDLAIIRRIRIVDIQGTCLFKINKAE